MMKQGVIKKIVEDLNGLECKNIGELLEGGINYFEGIGEYGVCWRIEYNWDIQTDEVAEDMSEFRMYLRNICCDTVGIVFEDDSMNELIGKYELELTVALIDKEQLLSECLRVVDELGEYEIMDALEIEDDSYAVASEILKSIQYDSIGIGKIVLAGTV